MRRNATTAVVIAAAIVVMGGNAITHADGATLG